MYVSKNVRATKYFEFVQKRNDRNSIKEEWILQTIAEPEKEETQTDGRIRRWKRIQEANGKALRVVLLEDGLTVHNVFFDRNFKG